MELEFSQTSEGKKWGEKMKKADSSLARNTRTAKQDKVIIELVKSVQFT